MHLLELPAVPLQRKLEKNLEVGLVSNRPGTRDNADNLPAVEEPHNTGRALRRSKKTQIDLRRYRPHFGRAEA